MRNWLDPFCEACDQWAARTGRPVTLLVGPLLDYTGGERPEYSDRSTASLRAWFHRLLDETGMHEYFLVFSAIQAVDAWNTEYLHRVDREVARVRARGRDDIDLEEERRSRRFARDTWRELTHEIPKGSAFDPE